ncbi:ArsR family transcriptional regulator [Flavobacterium sp.]|uniref:ArsR family transcriptional regulator n=2 Tax=Flavobacterium sp. TaxID=239 RepID=UPI0040488C56
MVKFFINVANTGYLRGLASEMQENTNAIRKELNNLSDAGFLIREEKESKVMYKANDLHPFFDVLQQLVRKHLGIDRIVTQIFERLGDVHQIYLVGDCAKGLDTGVIEVVVVGKKLNEAYVNQLAPKVSNELNKKVIIHAMSHFDGFGVLVFEK